MSYLKTKNALIQQLLTVVDAGDVAFENKAFDPKGKDFYYACYFVPVLAESTGKTLNSSDEQRGFFQVSVFVKSNVNYDIIQLEKADLISSAFRDTTNIEFDGQRVEILESTLNAGFIDEPWFKRDLTINYLTFTTRT